MSEATTHVVRTFDAPCERVFRALIDPGDVQRWMAPENMTCEIHTYEPVVGGRFRVSLTYTDDETAGKSTAHRDTYGGRFTQIDPPRAVTQVLAFETADPAMQGEMTMRFELEAVGGKTRLAAWHEGLPPGVDPELNALGWNLSLDNLARLLESSS